MSPAIESTEYSPFFLLFGKEMNLPFDIGIQPKENMGSDAKDHINDVIDTLGAPNLQNISEYRAFAIDEASCVFKGKASDHREKLSTISNTHLSV
jgi:hypothetical protein